MRFEVISAFALGGLIPIMGTCLDYCRNDYSFSLADFTGNLPDYVACALLLSAAWFALRLRAFASVFLVLGWAYFTCLMFDSLWGQIESTLRDDPEPFNAAVIVFKLAFMITCVVSLAMSFRRAVGPTGQNS
jgi:hypothetical protein